VVKLLCHIIAGKPCLQAIEIHMECPLHASSMEKSKSNSVRGLREVVYSRTPPIVVISVKGVLLAQELQHNQNASTHNYGPTHVLQFHHKGRDLLRY